MARGCKAVEVGSMRKQPCRSCRQPTSADTATPSNVAKASPPMDSTNPKPKRTPRRAAKDRFEEEKLMTSDKSQLIDIDLVKLLALPEAWNCLEEDEKKEILNLLPSDTHPNPFSRPDDPDSKISPLPNDFLRYDNNWRDGIRHFQLDLQNGRYDPQWTRDAEQAVRDRAAGKFDKFKEQEFEEFWGQKQKMDKYIPAGESSRVKLGTLIEQGVIRKGDIWKWSRNFGRRPKVLVEKEAKIIDINGAQLTFMVPAGQRVFLKTPATPAAHEPVTGGKPETDPSTLVASSFDGAATIDTEPGPSRKRSAEPEAEVTTTKRQRGRTRKQEATTVEEKACKISVEIVNTVSKSETTSSLSDSNVNLEPSAESQDGESQPVQQVPEDIKPVDVQPLQSAPELNGEKPVGVEPLQSTPELNGESDEVIIPNIQGPTALTQKMLEVDGRITNATNGNAWKELRCYRDNQDMGTLWEVRQAWFVKKN